MHRKLLFIVLPIAALSQTQVDLHTQSKSVDFTSATFTRPVKTGTTLPGTCSTGDLYFNTAAAAGSNLYGCVSTNTWVLQSGGSGGGGGGGTGTVTWQTGGSTTASASQADFVAGAGILLAGTAPGGTYELQASADQSFMLSRGNAQVGTTMTLTETSSSSSAYTTTTNPVFSALPSGSSQLPVWSWKVVNGCSGGALTMQVNTLPATPASLLNPDGSNPTTSQCAAGQKLLVTYDSVANTFVIVGGEASGSGGGGGGGSTSLVLFNGPVVSCINGQAYPLLNVTNVSYNCNSSTPAGGASGGVALMSTAVTTSGIVYQFIWPSGVTALNVQVFGWAGSSASLTVTMTAALGCSSPTGAFGSGTHNSGVTGSATSSYGNYNAFSMNSLALTGCSAGYPAFVQIVPSGAYLSAGDIYYVTNVVITATL